ncbi:MAG: hypothetical protein KDB27_00900 [Planctomycetales bacterium]|nr:hypothetical protein [Planctomycetales bacterium]
MSKAADEPTTGESLPWLFSRRIDLWTFLGSAVLAITLVLLGIPLGIVNDDTPDWLWIGAVLMIDVAHVYATGFRVYFDRTELRRRPWLYGLTPLLAFLIGWAIHSESKTLFWRLLAYLAVFHFVRQQYGWVALYRSRESDSDRVGWWIDATAIYLATIYPLLHWHANLPRTFWWFLEGDFAALPAELATYAAPIYWTALTLYAARSIYRGVARKQWNPGKDVVVATTAVCWYVGIVSFNSDYAFTVTNVITHGVPYMVLVYWYSWRTTKRNDTAQAHHVPRIAMFLGIVWALAYAEELAWDCGYWHEHGWLFGSEWNLGILESIVAPLLAVPQITHYVLDGFIWRRRSNRTFAEIVKL